MDDGTVRTPDGVRLRVRSDGEVGRPVLLTITSLGTDLSLWDGQVPAWSTTHRVLRYDQRGQGGSSAPPGPYTIEQFGTDALAVLDAHAVDRADICGISLGGVVALWLAIHAPDRVRRVVLADTAARIGTGEAWRARADLVRADGMDAVVEMVLARFFSPAFRAGGAPAVAHVGQGLRAADPEGYAGACEALAAADLTPLAGRVEAPCLVVVGTADEATPPGDAQTLRDLLPDAGYAEIEDAGHLPNLEQPAAFAQLVHRFLVP